MLTRTLKATASSAPLEIKGVRFPRTDVTSWPCYTHPLLAPLRAGFEPAFAVWGGRHANKEAKDKF